MSKRNLLIIIVVFVAGFYLGRTTTQSASKISNIQQPLAKDSTQQWASQPVNEKSQTVAAEQVPSQTPKHASRTESEEVINPEDEDFSEVNFTPYIEGEFVVLKSNYNFRSAVKALEQENGISHWGVERSNLFADLANEQAPDVSVDSIECKIALCLVRGHARSSEAAQAFKDAYVETQYWGVHYDQYKSKNGDYVFFLATYRLSEALTNDRPSQGE